VTTVINTSVNDSDRDLTSAISDAHPTTHPPFHCAHPDPSANPHSHLHLHHQHRPTSSALSVVTSRLVHQGSPPRFRGSPRGPWDSAALEEILQHLVPRRAPRISDVGTSAPEGGARAAALHFCQSTLDRRQREGRRAQGPDEAGGVDASVRVRMMPRGARSRRISSRESLVRASGEGSTACYRMRKKTKKKGREVRAYFEACTRDVCSFRAPASSPKSIPASDNRPRSHALPHTFPSKPWRSTAIFPQLSLSTGITMRSRMSVFGFLQLGDFSAQDIIVAWMRRGACGGARHENLFRQCRWTNPSARWS
jgi:hypothetical protein